MAEAVALKFQLTPSDLACVSRWDQRVKDMENEFGWMKMAAAYIAMVLAYHFLKGYSWRGANLEVLTYAAVLAVLVGAFRLGTYLLTKVAWGRKLMGIGDNPPTPEEQWVEVRLSEDRITFKYLDKTQEAGWRDILNAVSTPDGLMLYWHSHALNDFAHDVWLPIRVFPDTQIRDRVFDLVRRKARKFSTLDASVSGVDPLTPG